MPFASSSSYNFHHKVFSIKSCLNLFRLQKAIFFNESNIAKILKKITANFRSWKTNCPAKITLRAKDKQSLEVTDYHIDHDHEEVNIHRYLKIIIIINLFNMLIN